MKHVRNTDNHWNVRNTDNHWNTLGTRTVNKTLQEYGQSLKLVRNTDSHWNTSGTRTIESSRCGKTRTRTCTSTGEVIDVELHVSILEVSDPSSWPVSWFKKKKLINSLFSLSRRRRRRWSDWTIKCLGCYFYGSYLLLWQLVGSICWPPINEMI